MPRSVSASRGNVNFPQIVWRVCQMTAGRYTCTRIYTRNSTGHHDFLVQVQLSNIRVCIYTFHGLPRNLDDTENEPTFRCISLPRIYARRIYYDADVPPSNNPVFHGNTRSCACARGPLLFSPLLARFAPVSRVSHFQLWPPSVRSSSIRNSSTSV